MLMALPLHDGGPATARPTLARSPKINRWRRCAPILIAAAALGLLAAGCNKSAPPAGGPPAPPPPTVTVKHPEPREVMDWDEYPGRMEAKDRVDVKARVGGYLQEVKFKEGAEVQKGDLLFVIDPRPYQAAWDMAEAAVQQAQTHLELASNDMARSDRMLKSQAISAEEADARQSAYRAAVSALVSARASGETAALNLEYAKITAPISGRIGRKMVTEGNLVNGTLAESSLLATIVSLEPVYCYFEADERSFLKYQQMAREGKGENIRDGKVVCEAALANETGFPHEGTLDFVDNQADPTTGTVRLRGVFPNVDRMLQPGFFARVRVPGSGKYQALLIPDEAVGTDQSQKYVLTLSATNTADYRRVTLGPLVDGLRVAREGLGSNDWVVVAGLMSVRPGGTVNPEKK
jgi:multidrug efflux system membrane fusion protein